MEESARESVAVITGANSLENNVCILILIIMFTLEQKE